MPKKSAVDKLVESSGNVDAEAVDAIRDMATSLGRAISLSCVAAIAKPSITEEAIEAMDRAWVGLADKIVLFALEED